MWYNSLLELFKFPPKYLIWKLNIIYLYIQMCTCVFVCVTSAQAVLVSATTSWIFGFATIHIFLSDIKIKFSVISRPPFLVSYPFDILSTSFLLHHFQRTYSVFGIFNIFRIFEIMYSLYFGRKSQRTDWQNNIVSVLRIFTFIYFWSSTLVWSSI